MQTLDDIQSEAEAVINVLLELIRLGHALVGTLSGGKDSSCVILLMLEAVRRAKLAGVVQATHYISSADTTIENPAMENHLLLMHEEIRLMCARDQLPVEIHVAKPSLASQFVVTTIGRGTLVRTPENGVKDGKRIRACSQDWKSSPQIRLAQELGKRVMAQGFREPITLLGTRYDESISRASSMVKHGASAIAPVRNDKGALYLSPVAHWTIDDVWSLLAMFSETRYNPFPTFTDGRTIHRMMDLYRAGNEGTCGVTLGDGGNKSACGSRFGCAFCCITGERDKSMESMIKEPQHAHLAGLNRFRNYLVATQWDMSKRELVGRSLSSGGYIRVKPDVYSYAHRVTLLRYLLTLDALEQERAEQHEADLVSGRIDDTTENRELCEVQFEMVTFQQLVAIDFQLSMHHYAPHAFPAVSIWHEVHVLGRRYHVPETTIAPKVTVKSHGWIHIGQFNAQAPTDGLRSYTDEQWNPYRHPERASAYARTTGGERITYFEEDDCLEVDAIEACTFISCNFDTAFMLKAQSFEPLESARFWLNEGILKLPKGMSQTYQEMAVRGQYFFRLAERLNLTPAELDQYLIQNAISDAEHERLLVRERAQQDLFGDLLTAA